MESVEADKAAYRKVYSLEGPSAHLVSGLDNLVPELGESGLLVIHFVLK